MDRLPLLEKVPPQNLEAEQSTLGAMMLERPAIEKAVEILRPEDFYWEHHQDIFSAIVDIADRDEPVDLITLTNQLRVTGKLDRIGGVEYVETVLDAVPSAANIEYYAKIVEQKAILRRLIGVASDVLGQAYGTVEDVDELVDRAERMIFGVAQRRVGQYFSPLRPLLTESFERIEHISMNKGGTTGVETGFTDLNYITSGLQPSDLVILAARPSMGKTSLAMGIGQHVGKQLPAAIFSLEMSKEQLAMRMICSEARVDAHRLRTGYLTDDDFSKIARAVDQLWDARIFIDDSPDCSVMEMRAKCRRLKAEQGELGLIVVDYLQLIRGHTRSENRNTEITEIARSLKSMARELKVPVMALSQLSRAVERREDKHPMLSDLRESGSIEAEADVVMFIYRPKYYDQKGEISPESQQEGEEAEIIIAKQRNGPTGTVRVTFIPKYAKFENRAPDYMEER
ncbi:MAG: replicative DNA helicase [Armatimonadetes bacterium]|nr:replicative DNA helicase [Armatimonadota bacterium]